MMALEYSQTVDKIILSQVQIIDIYEVRCLIYNRIDLQLWQSKQPNGRLSQSCYQPCFLLC
jgi:hypothetical protein